MTITSDGATRLDNPYVSMQAAFNRHLLWAWFFNGDKVFAVAIERILASTTAFAASGSNLRGCTNPAVVEL